MAELVYDVYDEIVESCFVFSLVIAKIAKIKVKKIVLYEVARP